MRDLILERSATALGLHAYASDGPADEVFGDFYEATLGLLERYGLRPTYVGANGAGYSGDYVKFPGRTQRRLMNTGFKGLSSLSFVVNPPDSDEPSYDNYVSVSLGYVAAWRELVLSCVINEAILPFAEDDVRAVLSALIPVHEWYGGYCFSDNVERQPELFIHGLNSGKLSAQEVRDLEVWYEAPVEERMKGLRGIFPYNIISEVHLEREIEQGVSLHNFIGEQRSPLDRITDYGLYLWIVSRDKMGSISAAVRRSDLLVGDG